MVIRNPHLEEEAQRRLDRQGITAEHIFEGKFSVELNLAELIAFSWLARDDEWGERVRDAREDLGLE